MDKSHRKWGGAIPVKMVMRGHLECLKMDVVRNTQATATNPQIVLIDIKLLVNKSISGDKRWTNAENSKQEYHVFILCNRLRDAMF